MRVVTCNGCFETLHPGHLFFLGYCLSRGSDLVVGINSDEYIRRVKCREPVPEPVRVKALMDLGCVTDVVVYSEDDPCEFIQSVNPDVHCIGEEYRGMAPELPLLESLSVEVVYVPRVGVWSSTAVRFAQTVSVGV